MLVLWARASRILVQVALCTKALQALVGVGLVATLLYLHFLRSGGSNGADLLLVYWALKLPALGQTLLSLAHQYPAQRNVLLRLLEPIAAPTELPPAAGSTSAFPAIEPEVARASGMRIDIADGYVLAGGHSILQKISLHIAAGEHVAVVGASGAGKSTLFGLLLGWHRLAGGTLLTDGVPLTDLRQQALRRCTAWVDPGIQIWNSPMLENLHYACDAGQPGDTSTVIDAADLRRVLQKLPLGLQTFLGEGGALLSGGEGQRVRLARALMQPLVRLVLLDEPFRGLDRTQRTRLLAQARQWWQQQTVLCVTHDVAETLGFDRVVVIDDGRIVEDGPPTQLAAGATRYRALLDAEMRVRAGLWQGTEWRRIRIAHGQVEGGAATQLNL